MKNNNEIPEGFVLVTKQIIKDNVYMGEEEVLVWGEKAEQQLSLPMEERNPHWRNVKLKAQDSKPQSIGAEPAHEVAAAPAESAKIEIPKKRNRTV